MRLQGRNHDAIGCRAGLAALLIACAIAAPRAQDAAAVVSMDRVRAALERPPSKLTLEERKPDFRVEVVWHHPFHEIFDTPPWQLPPIGWQPPAVGFNLLSIFQSLARSAENAKHDHDERVAHEEVIRALGDFCAAQPDAGAHVPACASVPVIR